MYISGHGFYQNTNEFLLRISALVSKGQIKKLIKTFMFISFKYESTYIFLDSISLKSSWKILFVFGFLLISRTLKCKIRKGLL